MKILHDAVDQIAAVQWLDRIGDRLSDAVHSVIPHGAVKDGLSGTWLGHPLHPILTDIPIGSFTSATVLDLIGGRRSHNAADTLVAIGVASAVPTALAGAADWSDTSAADKTIGTAHALLNTLGVTLYAYSLIPRRRRQRAVGTLFGLAGMGAMTAAGYLGGHLSYTRGVGVNQLAFDAPGDDWAPVLDATDLTDGNVLAVDAGELEVLLHRRGERIVAIANRCSHAGGPLADGMIDPDACTVECPWHHSVFDLEDGSVVHGPATARQPAFETRIRAGRIEVRPHRR